MGSERSHVTQTNQLRNSTSAVNSTSGPSGAIGLPQTQNGPPPPIPPRQTTQNYSGYNDYRPFASNYYNGYGAGYGYGNQYRSYGGYGSFGYSPYSTMAGYNSYGPMGGPSGDVESRFLQYAEESTRSTFRVIETVLQTFSSLTMLLESTYFAMTNSFRAILSVAENIARLKSTLGQLLSTFALIRFLKWLYKKVMGIAGIASNNPDEVLWERTLARANRGENPTNVPSSWSGLLMFSVFVIIPYIIHRISSNAKQLQAQESTVLGADPREWYKSEEPVYSAIVQYDFVAGNSDELSVRTGQKVYLAPQSLQPKNLPGWCKVTDNMSVGLVPYNYITLVGQLKRKPKSEDNVSVTSAVSAASVASIPISPTVEKPNTETSVINDKDNNIEQTTSEQYIPQITS